MRLYLLGWLLWVLAGSLVWVARRVCGSVFVSLLRKGSGVVQVHLTLAPSETNPSGLYVSFATPRAEEGEEAPQGSGVYYRVKGTSEWNFAGAKVTAYNFSATDYPYYVSPWFHHSLLEDGVGQKQTVEYSPAATQTSSGMWNV